MIKNQNRYLLNKRLKILEFAKIIIPKQGFKSDIFKIIEDTFNLDQNEADLIFPEGNNDLIKFALEQLNKDLQEHCKKIDLIRLPIHKRIRIILLTKISLMNKEKEFYKKIFLNILVPKKNFSLPYQLYKSIDQIWFIAGDNSTDFNFYTKRLILSVIYTRVILFFFNNNDQDKLEIILDDNLKRVSKIPKLKSKISIIKNNFPNILKLIKNFN
jgi:ubiquinone biosynthesis protein COQ9